MVYEFTAFANTEKYASFIANAVRNPAMGVHTKALTKNSNGRYPVRVHLATESKEFASYAKDIVARLSFLERSVERM